MNSLADRFRRWYQYECDCNAKTLAMLESVPPENRAAPEFARAVGRMGHLVAARQRWLNRLGHEGPMLDAFPAVPLADLPAIVATTEQAWERYLSDLDEVELAREFQWQLLDGRKFSWNVEGVLTQVFGHAWYHRGQIAQLVAQLGGKAVDTDYIFWCKPQQVS